MLPLLSFRAKNSVVFRRTWAQRPRTQRRGGWSRYAGHGGVALTAPVPALAMASDSCLEHQELPARAGADELWVF